MSEENKTSILDRLPKVLTQHMKTFMPTYETATMNILFDDFGDTDLNGDIVTTLSFEILAQITPDRKNIQISYKLMDRSYVINTEGVVKKMLIKNDTKQLFKCVKILTKHLREFEVIMMFYQKPEACDLDKCKTSYDGNYDYVMDTFLKRDDDETFRNHACVDWDSIEMYCDMLGSVSI